MPKRLKVKGRREAGSFSAWPHVCSGHENFFALSHTARSLLFEFLGQLRGNNNGDLTCAWAILRKRGWRSRDTIERARAELEARGWIIRTRQGGRNAPNLYAVTWRGIDECGGKLDIPSTFAPPGDWKKQFDMTDSRATLDREVGKPRPGDGQPHSNLAREAA